MHSFHIDTTTAFTPESSERSMLVGAISGGVAAGVLCVLLLVVVVLLVLFLWRRTHKVKIMTILDK